ncbi:MAG: hypothetical protein WBP45_05680 [Daejeonella sp.]
MEITHKDEGGSKDSKKIYFLIIVIAVLLGTNVYLFFKDQKTNERILTISDEKTRMQTEIDKIEAELDNVTTNNVKLSEQMQQEQDLARKQIEELRISLKKGEITQVQLVKAQEEIKKLRRFVTAYTIEIEELKKKNALLTNERDILKTAIDSVNIKTSNLEKTNKELKSKVKVAAALKASNISIIPLKVKSNGKETEVTKAKTTKKLRISFSVVDNPIAEKRLYNIYIRIIDPSGNLIVVSNTGTFTSVDGEDLQFSYKTAIEFTNEDKVYTIDWQNMESFQKGTYTIILYGDNSTMGKEYVILQ